MELQYHMKTDQLHWTNEKHMQFLNSIELSFVQTMMDMNNIQFQYPVASAAIDRHLPDALESTQDMKSQPQRTKRRRKHAPALNSGERSWMYSSRAGKRTKRAQSLSSDQPCNSSEDQVVPQIFDEN